VFPKSSKSWGYPQIIQVPSPTKFYATENVTWGSREGPGLPGPTRLWEAWHLTHGLVWVENHWKIQC
jgi:hypothetical protein